MLRRLSLPALCLLLGTALRSSAQSPPSDTTITVDRDIPYIAGGVAAQRLDIYRPTIAPARPLPLLIWLHGGGWMMGSKAYCPGSMIATSGYEVASVEYRFSTAAKFPAQIQDCQAAVRWLRAHHAQYGFDPDRIGVIGESAGGHLAALLGTAGGTKKFTPIGENLDVSDQVQAVCDCYGPSDFSTLIAQVKADQSVNNIFAPIFLQEEAADKNGAGRASASEKSGDTTDLFKMLTGNRLGVDPAMDAMVSPVTYVAAHAPPFLIMHGTKDNLVPFAQSVELADRLRKSGDSVVLQLIAGAGHGGRTFYDPRVLTLIKTFFDQTLKGMDVIAKPIDALSPPG